MCAVSEWFVLILLEHTSRKFCYDFTYLYSVQDESNNLIFYLLDLCDQIIPVGFSFLPVGKVGGTGTVPHYFI